MQPLVSALAGVALGLSLAAPPGPMNAVIAEESVLRGWGAGLRAGFGAMTADACFFVLALIGVVAVVRDAPVLRGVLFGVGGLLMLYFAYGAATDASEAFTAEEEQTADDEESKGFRKAFALALTNPYQILWWLTAGVGLLEPGSVSLDALGGLSVATGSPVIVVGFFAGIALWITGFPAALVAAGKRVDAFAPVVAVLSAAVLALAGLTFLSQAVTTLG
ncbi:LysE family translocator [Halorussus halophilus]|uniref:LysE family translocator n=1 Tax=Halorussus halophilus TaxID=2650975 RepID=UPI001787921B